MKILLACLLCALPLQAQIVESNATFLGTITNRANSILGAILAEWPSAVGGDTNMPFRLYSSNTKFHPGKPADYTMCLGWNTDQSGNQLNTNYGTIEICVEGGYNSEDGAEYCELQVRMRDKYGVFLRPLEIRGDLNNIRNQVMSLRSGNIQLYDGTNELGYAGISASQIIYVWPGQVNGFKILQNTTNGTQIISLGENQTLVLAQWLALDVPGVHHTHDLMSVHAQMVVGPGKVGDYQSSAYHTTIRLDGNRGITVASNQAIRFAHTVNVFSGGNEAALAWIGTNLCVIDSGKTNRIVFAPYP